MTELIPVYGDSGPAPRRGAPALRLLSTMSLDRQIRAINGAATQQEAGLDRATETLQLLRDPSINAVVSTMAALPDGEATVVADVATALLGSGKRRQRLILALRSAMESVS